MPRQLGGYRVVAKLGQGGMATVFKAHNAVLDRVVALKVLAPAQAQLQDMRTRFMREIRLAARIQHQNVICCYDAGEADGFLYMALELAEHGDALALLRSRGRLDEPLALVLMRDCALGLQAIHRAGMLHRDIKPANIFLTAPTVAKLADLGVAKDIRRLSASDTGPLRPIIGTPAYMSPEQANRDKPTPRSDIYSLGATFFHLLTGRLPFQGSGRHETIDRLRTESPIDPTEAAPDLSDASAAILRTCMARDPACRYEDCADVLRDIERLLLERPAELPMAYTTGEELVYTPRRPPTLQPHAP